MKNLIALLVTVVAIPSAFSEVGAAEGGVAKKMTDEQRAKWLERVEIAKGGPKVERPGTQQGSITIVNAQTTAKSQWIEEGCAYLADDTHFKIEVRQGTYDSSKPTVFGQMTLYVIDDSTQPKLLVATDDRWAMFNVATLKSDKAAFFEARVKKQLSRVFAMLCGGMSSGLKLSLAGAITKVEDLDVFPNAKIPYDVGTRIRQYMESFGVKPTTIKPYKVACQEGWAPAPTNNVQKAIWNQVHELPTKPIEIKYDKAAGK